VARSPSAPNPLRPAAARLALAATVVGPSAAMAQGLLVPAGETLVPEEVRRLVVDEGRTALVVEELVVRGSARRFVLARALPAAPTGVFDPGAPLFDVLEHETAVLKPLRRELEERPFGPSVLTGALHRWRESERLPRPPPIEAPGARLALVPSAALVVDEPARTSTRTGQRRLPERVERYLAAEGMGPRSSAADRVLRNYPERSALLLFTLDAPGGAERFVVGPIAYRIPKGEADPIPVIPLSGVGTVPTGGTLERTYAWGTQPLVPTNDAVAIDREPWANPPPSGTVRLVSVMPTPSAVRSALLDATPVGELLARADGRVRAVDGERPVMRPLPLSTRLPGRGRRGDALDYALLVLEGLAPLLLTPEAWLCFWAAESAENARRRGQPRSLLAFAWALFALMVAAYWLNAFDGPARWAATLPTILGIWRLIVPPPEADARVLRAALRKKRHEAAPELEAASVAPSTTKAAPIPSLRPAGTRPSKSGSSKSAPPSKAARSSKA
jgi:hypothetical protein